MSPKPDLTTMNTTEIRSYVLEHRDDEEALHTYLDRLHSENSGSRTYGSGDSVAEAIADYLRDKKLN